MFTDSTPRADIKLMVVIWPILMCYFTITIIYMQVLMSKLSPMEEFVLLLGMLVEEL